MIELQQYAKKNKPNLHILSKLQEEMKRLAEERVSRGGRMPGGAAGVASPLPCAAPHLLLHMTPLTAWLLLGGDTEEAQDVYRGLCPARGGAAVHRGRVRAWAGRSGETHGCSHRPPSPAPPLWPRAEAQRGWPGAALPRALPTGVRGHGQGWTLLVCTAADFL